MLKYLLLVVFITASSLSQAEFVKQSKSGICHDSSSTWYEKTKNFEAFNSVKDCIAKGGRLPRNTKATTSAKKENLQYSAVYDRKSWKHWTDDDRDCQDTRQEVLIKASSIAVKFKTSKNCKVKSGKFYDPFSDKIWTNPSDVDADHIVPLAWAHRHGGANWSKKQKRIFANDFSNLIAVEDNLNQSKSAQGPDRWLPPNHSYRCEYIARFNTIVKKYKLIYVSSEKRIITKMLNKCG